MSDEYKGFVKLHRKIVESKIFDDAFTYKVFSYCMIKAKFKKNSNVELGQFETTYEKMAKELKMTRKTVDKHLKKLEKLEAVKVKSTFYKTVIQVVNFENYNNVISESIEDEPTGTSEDKEEEIGELDLKAMFADD